MVREYQSNYLEDRERSFLEMRVSPGRVYTCVRERNGGCTNIGTLVSEVCWLR